MPSAQCDEYYDFNNHGQDWLCTCQTGRAQSPIDIYPFPRFIPMLQSATFQFYRVLTKPFYVIFEKGLMRIKCEGFCTGFGRVTDIDFAEYLRSSFSSNFQRLK